MTRLPRTYWGSVLALAVVAIVATTASAALAASFRANAARSSVVGGMRFHKLAQLPRGSVPTALSAGSLIWVTLRGNGPDRAGKALGFDRNGTLRARLSIGSVPVAAASSANSIWVANGTVPGYRHALEQGTVDEFRGSRISPSRRKTIAFNEPASLLSSPSGTWLVAAASKTGTPVVIRSLANSSNAPRVTLPMTIGDESSGTGKVATLCAGHLYVAGNAPSGAVRLALLTPSLRLLSTTTENADGIPSVACGRNGRNDIPLLLISGHGGGLRCLRPRDNCAKGTFGNPNLTAAVGVGTSIIALDPAAFGVSAGVDRLDLSTGKLVSVTRVPKAGPVRVAVSAGQLFLLDGNDLYSVSLH